MINISESLGKVCDWGDRVYLFQDVLYEYRISYKIIEYGRMDALNIVISYCNDDRYDTVFAAHFDRVLPEGGANDNAAACLSLIELAARLKRMNYRGPLAIVLFDNEEPCNRYRDDRFVAGSHLFAQNLIRRGITPGLFIVLDAAGYGNQLFYSEGGDESMLETVRQVVPDLPGRRTPGSDDLILKRLGIESVLLGTVPANEWSHDRPNTWSFFHSNLDVPVTVSTETIRWVTDHLMEMIPGGSMQPVEWTPTLSTARDEFEQERKAAFIEMIEKYRETLN